VNAVIGKLSKEGKDAVYSVSQAVKEDIEKQGLLNVEYKGGRKVSLSSYAAMAARSARIESANIGTFGRALENGTDYVKCTEIYPTCEICAKYQGKIYCISGKDKRFPALFETALRHGYALMHPNCRHEFVPVWLETMSGAELAEMIEKSKISPKADTRSEEERNAYAAWQAKQRQIYHERLYFEQAKQRLGKAMPYESIAAFRRSYRTAEDTFAHKRSHNLIKDYKEYNELKAVLQGDDLPKTLAEYQKLRYNNDVKYEKLLREKQTLLKVKEKGWSEIFTAKAIETFYRFKKVGIEFTDHGLARFLSRKFTIEEIVSINDKPFNYYQDDGKKVKFYDNIAVIYDSENNTVISVMERKRIREDWHEIEN
jgi:phage minor capsid protein 2